MMLSRVIVPAGVVIIGAPMVTSTVFAAESELAKQKSKSLVKPSELPLYGEPAKPDLVYIPEETNAYREGVSTVRKTIWDATVGLHGAIDATKKAYHVTSDYIADVKAKVREDSAVLHRAGIITVAGLGGVVAGYKGGVLRKAVFASASMTTAAAICYPKQAVDISSTGLNRIKHEAMGVWQQVSGKPSEKSAPTQEPAPAVNEKREETQKDMTIMQEKQEAVAMSSTPAEDPGQSKPEDGDLYASRSSK